MALNLPKPIGDRDWIFSLYFRRELIHVVSICPVFFKFHEIHPEGFSIRQPFDSNLPVIDGFFILFPLEGDSTFFPFVHDPFSSSVHKSD